MKPVCVTCGTQFAEQTAWPERCPICEDERQYIGLSGQQWTTAEQLSRDFRVSFVEEEPQLTSFSMTPKFGIGQRAFLVETPEGNLLWDCISLLNDELAEFVNRRGGLTAIAISHPHYYTTMVDWSERFGGVPIYLHEDDCAWVMRPAHTIVALERRTTVSVRRFELIAVRRTLPGGERSPRGARCVMDRRHDSGVPGSAQCELHVQLSELHPTKCRAGEAHPGGSRAAGL